jgi:hypothetical protein
MPLARILRNCSRGSTRPFWGTVLWYNWSMESSRPFGPIVGHQDGTQNLAEGSGRAAPVPHSRDVANRAIVGEAPRGGSDGTSVPELLRGLFWDCQFDDLRLPRDLPFIIGRVLASGTWSQIKWLRAKVGDDRLRQWILEHEGRLLDPPQLRFWELILDLPSRQVDGWLACRSRWVWDHRTGDHRTGGEFRQ